MRFWVPLALLAVVALAAACVSTGALTPGERLVRSKCGACHLRPEPTRLPPAAWPAVLDRHAGRVPLSPEEWSSLGAFLSGAPGGASATP